MSGHREPAQSSNRLPNRGTIGIRDAVQVVARIEFNGEAISTDEARALANGLLVAVNDVENHNERTRKEFARND